MLAQQINLGDSEVIETPWKKRIGKKINLTDQTFGRLTVIEEASPRVYKNGRKIYMWKCECECGNVCTVATADLRSGHTTSCGCYRRERQSECNSTHGLSKSRLYNIYRDMVRRCNDPKSDHYKWYGNKGIKICEQWSGDDGIHEFVKWALQNGYEDNLTIDRIDGNKGYEPSNCRWATKKQQSNNISSNRILEYKGCKYTLSELAEKTGINYSTLNNRINTAKISVEEAIEKPIDESKRRTRQREVKHS